MKYRFDSYYLDSPLVKGRVFDVFFPEEVTRDLAIFIVHGGGWSAGSRASFHKFMEIFSDMGYVVASTDYRLSGVNAFEQLTDVRDAYARFCDLLSERGIEPRVAVCGESAGAHLASLLAYTNPGEIGENCPHYDNWVKPSLAVFQATPVDFCPFEAMMESTRAMMEGAAGCAYENDPDRYERLSLKNYIREDNPPTFFLEAGWEHLFPSDATHAVYTRHRELGIPSFWKVYERMEHGFLYELKRAAQREAFADICAFLEGKLEG